ncbi:glycosyltransferase family 4 protein [Motiliproteus coralliicola]|uniref:glycosyltransferase family 4 protein n=1 Tax=Motiliproteus coralliicola TaxID=2283196 RepID=UPI001A9F6B55|nr:glycosyltransferase family 4 protein [Motiliproteus coralliicola]
MSSQIAVVLKGYPRLSETFIAQELYQLEQRGLKLIIVSLRHPTDKDIHPIHKQIQAPVLYLPEYLHQEPLRVLRGLFSALKRPGFGRALRSWWKDLRREPSRNRIRRFGQALVLSRELPVSVQQLYAHFIHTPASVTRYCAQINALPWSASAHAKDIWTLEEWELREKLAELEWLVTCTRANTEHLQGLSADPTRVELLYHGLDFDRFPAPANNKHHDEEQPRDGSDQPVRLISVGRAVEKKGYDHLLNALAALPPQLNWHFTHIGGGTLLKQLQAQANELGLSDRIDWLGALPQLEVLERYRNADLFVLASQVIGDGDRDGLPNVLMEAQSQRLCCLATNISGIPELIDHQQTGLLVEQRDVEGLSVALEQLIRQPELRDQLAEAGYRRVTDGFSVHRGIDQLMQKFSHLTAEKSTQQDGGA